MTKLSEEIAQKVDEGVFLRVMTDGECPVLKENLFIHISLFAQGSVARPMIVVRDESEVLIGLNDHKFHAIWSTNPVLMEMALTHIKHEYAIYKLSQKMGEKEMRNLIN